MERDTDGRREVEAVNLVVGSDKSIVYSVDTNRHPGDEENNCVQKSKLGVFPMYGIEARRSFSQGGLTSRG
jgi:hypothetical protein